MHATYLWKKIIHGRYIEDNQSQVLISDATARSCNIRVGQDLLFRSGSREAYSLTVSGIFKTGIDRIDNELAFCPISIVTENKTIWNGAVFSFIAHMFISDFLPGCRHLADSHCHPAENLCYFEKHITMIQVIQISKTFRSGAGIVQVLSDISFTLGQVELILIPCQKGRGLFSSEKIWDLFFRQAIFFHIFP